MSSGRRWRVALAACAVYALLLALSLQARSALPRGEEATDVGRVVSARVDRTVAVRSAEDARRAIREAAAEGRKISIAGTRHSMGGQTFAEGAVVLDMKRYDRILAIDEQARTITAEAGATWADIQQAVNPLGLSVRVMQSQNLFTLGGSLSANIHGRDPSEGPLISTVRSIRVLLADGSIVTASRAERPELFRAAIGGFGGLGVILEATLELTADEVYEARTSILTYREFPQRFEEAARSPDTGLLIARLSTAPEHFLERMYMTEYRRTGLPLERGDRELKQDRAVELTRFVFGLQRKYGWGKSLSWSFQERLFRSEQGALITRNNAMRPESDFLEYRDAQHSDLLQEYFIPLDRYEAFVDGLRELLREEPLNVVNITVRYMPQNGESALSYSASEDRAALVLLMNEKRSEARIERLERLTQRMIGLAQSFGGTYYLTYQPYATLEQFRRSYPDWEELAAVKRNVDPKSLFWNEWYETYGSEERGEGR
ncbi:FAD-binding oxidoreductase [Paenibacillus albicereus]|uniref:FAD-binding oxidoreductase n=1 Tax=Paenibacillus albicereus TaxID=2726185 RepID=A0A6H2H2W1_9BACL|nr:FAD-binding oxidoreductase [Paenibacillus albicereus]QJC54002.1 FAD-binding oxidoreductase [Paenibacillus albicereus]